MTRLLFKSKNGIDVNVIENRKFTGNLISVYFLGDMDDCASEKVLLSKVLSLSTEKYGSLGELNAFLELNYGASFSVGVFKEGESRVVRFSLAFIKNEYAFNGEKISDEMADFLYEVFRRPLIENGKFDETAVKIAKKSVLDLIASEKNNKAAYAFRRCREVMCENERFSLNELGDEKRIKELTAEDLYRYYPEFLDNSNVYFQFVGDFSKEYAEKLVDRIFPNPIFPKRLSSAEVIKAATAVKTVEETKKAAQSVLVSGYRIGLESAEDECAYIVLNSLLGGGANSLFFKNIREKSSLCYFCSSSINTVKGVMFVCSGISAADKEKMLAAVDAEIAAVKRGKISERDVSFAKAELINAFKQVGDSLSSIDSYCFEEYFTGTLRSCEETVSLISEVLLSDVVSLANRLSLDTVYFMKGTEGERIED